MDSITETLKSYYAKTFEQHGATAKGVDWGDEDELLIRYDKMLRVLDKDFMPHAISYSMLDVGCGWGGLYKRLTELGISIDYSGIDVVKSMIKHGQMQYPEATFFCEDVFSMENNEKFDFVVCNAILTQKLSSSNIEMEHFSKKLISKMFDLCNHGIAFNMMSTRVNFMVDNLYYQNPSELFSWLLSTISPRIRFDHGYSSLANGKGKFYDFTVYAYKG